MNTTTYTARWEVTETVITEDCGIYIDGKMTLQLVEFRGVPNRGTKIVIDFSVNPTTRRSDGAATRYQYAGDRGDRIGARVVGKITTQAALAKRVLAAAYADEDETSVWYKATHLVKVVDGAAFPKVG